MPARDEIFPLRLCLQRDRTIRVDNFEQLPLALVNARLRYPHAAQFTDKRRIAVQDDLNVVVRVAGYEPLAFEAFGFAFRNDVEYFAHPLAAAANRPFGVS